MHPINFFTALLLVLCGLLCRYFTRLTNKWNDDRLLNRGEGFFYGAALVILFV